MVFILGNTGQLELYVQMIKCWTAHGKRWLYKCTVAMVNSLVGIMQMDIWIYR